VDDRIVLITSEVKIKIHPLIKCTKKSVTLSVRTTRAYDPSYRPADDVYLTRSQRSMTFLCYRVPQKLLY